MITKMFIDSRRAYGNANDITVTVPESLSFPNKTICRIAEACIPHSWYTVDSVNHSLLLIYKDGADVAHLVRRYIPQQQYIATQFAVAVQAALSGHLESVADYFNEQAIKITISANQPFHLPSEEQLNLLSREGLSTNHSCNGLFENWTGNAVSLNQTDLHQTWTSSLDMMRYHSVFIHSSLADGQTVDVNMHRKMC